MSFAEFTVGIAVFGLLWALMVTPLVAMVWSVVEPEERLTVGDVLAFAGFSFAFMWLAAVLTWVLRWGVVWTHA